MAARDAAATAAAIAAAATAPTPLTEVDQMQRLRMGPSLRDSEQVKP